MSKSMHDDPDTVLKHAGKRSSASIWHDGVKAQDACFRTNR